MEFVNRICPNCNNPNYMVLLGDFSKAYKYKCINCNRYFNDIDFEKEPFRWSENMVEVVRCADCRHYGYKDMTNVDGFCYCLKRHEYPNPDWYCGDGERRETNDKG